MGSYFPFYGPDGRPLYPPQPIPMAPVDPRWLAQQQTAPLPYAGSAYGMNPQGYMPGALPSYGVPPLSQPPYAGFGYSMPPQGYMPGPQPVYGAYPPPLPYGMQPVAYPTRTGRDALDSQQNTVDGDEDESKDESKKPEVKTYAQISTEFPELSLAERVDLPKEPLNFPLEKKAADHKKDAPYQRKVEELMKKSKGGWPFKPGKQYACVPDNGRAFAVRLPYTKGATCKKCNKADHTEDQHGKFSLHFFDRNPRPGPSPVGGDKSDPSKNNQLQGTPGAGSSKKGEAGVVKGYDKVDPLLLKHYKVVHPGIWRVLKAFKDKLADVEKSLVSSQSAKAKADAEAERNLYKEKINGLYASHSKSCAWMPEVTQPPKDDPEVLSEEDESRAIRNALDWSNDDDTRVVPTYNSLDEMWKAHEANHGDPSLRVFIPKYDPADSCATDEPMGKSEAKLQLMEWRDDWHHDPEHHKFKSWDQARAKTVQSCCEEVSSLETGIEYDGARLSNDVKGKIMDWEQDHQSLYSLLGQLRQKCHRALVDIEKCGERENMRSKNIVMAFVAALLEDMKFSNDTYEFELTGLQLKITTAIDRAVKAKAQAEEVAVGVDDEGIKEYREKLLALFCAPVLGQLRRIKPQLSRAVWFIPRLEYCDFGSEILTSLNASEAAVEVEVP